MVERKQFKTKLCVPYQKGRCARHNCSFAHGNAELRRFSGSQSARRDYLGSDLRAKLDRRHLSPRRYSPARNARRRQGIHDYSPSRSLEEKSDRKRRKKQGVTGPSDISTSLKVCDRIRDQVKEGKFISSGSRNTLEDQLKKLQLDIDELEKQKIELRAFLDGSVQEVDSLNSRIQELEAQLSKEKEESKRITSRIRKFIKVHNHNSRLRDELKRSEFQLQRLGDQLASDFTRIGANEEDSSIDIVSNGENTGFPSTTKRNVQQNDASPPRKRMHVEREAIEELKQDKSKGERLIETARTRKRSQWNVPAQLDAQECKGPEGPSSVTEVNRPLDLEGKNNRGISKSSNNFISEKLKESRIEVPSTSMAAHVIEEEVEIELDDETKIIETARAENENRVAFGVKGLPLLLPPDITPRSNYSQYEGDDENVDVDGLDEEVAVGNVDIV